MKNRGIFYAVFFSLFFFAATAQAKTWIVDDANSHIAFTGTQGSDQFVGGFSKAKITIDFDQDHPENGKITAIIDPKSAFAGSSERDSELPKLEWFNTMKFSQAIFTSTNIQWDRNPNPPTLKDNIGCYSVAGYLIIKGMQHSVTMPFCLAPQGSKTHARGMLTLMRTDFGVGIGAYADTSFIKNEVTVTVDVVAQ